MWRTLVVNVTFYSLITFESSQVSLQVSEDWLDVTLTEYKYSLV